ncbi:Arf-GAP with GTPase, ANK repeat and PH domain-containing protein 1 [Orchesella cincta]|uniref:Arf-GAP with GTPase, ANK repeat and PH domain-containing protein 1 n=1 Tax=Orchesella cincta TaxID=48709 RepID=A0A1D2MM24_ORCCI|nr:Arf-GAP with GTPase, ANK repeat and PH domain-containing protein 1 [Orchesella cincta]
MMTGGGSALCSGGGGPPTSANSSIVSLSIRSEIHRFESVHPSIYSIYELLEQVQDSSVAQAIREHVVNIEDCFVNSQEWTLSRSVSDLHVGLLGSQMSPKSTLVHRYLTNQYVQDNSPEGGRFKKEIIVNSTPYLLLLRDEGGPPELQFSHWTDAIILVASSTQTTNTCFSYLTRFANYRSLNEVPIVLVSVEEHANASLEFIKEFKKIPHSGYFHVNVRTGVNVEQLFSEVCNMIVNKRTSMGPPPPPPSSLQRSNSSLSDKNITPVCTPTSSRKFRRRSNLFKSATQDLGSGRAIPVKQGCLLKKSNNSNSKITNKKWKKKYVTMSEGKIEYFDNLNAYMDNPNSGKVIDLKHVTVKLTRSAGHNVRTITDSLSTLSLKKQSSYNMHAANAGVEAYGFQLVSISKTWDFESTSKADRDEWVELIEEQIVKSLQANVADRVSSRKNEGACDEEILVVKNLNGVCADCGVQLSKGGGYWASLNLCVVVCIACSGVTGGSMELDEMSSLLISPLRSIESNSNSNLIYEACVPEHTKPGASCSDIERSSFIRRKYEHLEFLPAEPKTVNQDMVAKSIIDKDFFTFLLYVNVCRRAGDALFVDGKLLNVAISNEFIAAAQIILWMTNDGVGVVTPSCTPDRKGGFKNAQYYGNVGSPSELPCGVSSKVNLASASKLLNNNNNASNASSGSNNKKIVI